MFEDAIFAWKTGEVEGTRASRQMTPAVPPFCDERRYRRSNGADGDVGHDAGIELTPDGDVGAAEMRIDLSRIGGKQQAGPHWVDVNLRRGH